VGSGLAQAGVVGDELDELVAVHAGHDDVREMAWGFHAAAWRSAVLAVQDREWN